MMVMGLLSICKSFLSNMPKIDFDFGYLYASADFALDTIVRGIRFLGVFLGAQGLQAIYVYFGVLLAINSFYVAYQLIWWFIKKIPMIDVDQ